MPPFACGIEERGVVGGDDDVGLVQEVLRAAGGHSVYGGDHRFPTAMVRLRREREARVEGVPDVVLEEPARAALHVGARAERAVAVGLQHDGVHGVVVTNGLPRPRDLGGHLVVPRVQCFRAVQRDRRDVVVAYIELDGVALHAIECTQQSRDPQRQRLAFRALRRTRAAARHDAPLLARSSSGRRVPRVARRARRVRPADVARRRRAGLDRAPRSGALRRRERYRVSGSSTSPRSRRSSAASSIPGPCSRPTWSRICSTRDGSDAQCEQ